MAKRLKALDIPVIHLSVQWWRTLHQPATILRAGPAPMDPGMKWILYFNIAAMIVVYAYLLAVRVRVEDGRRAALDLKLRRAQGAR